MGWGDWCVVRWMMWSGEWCVVRWMMCGQVNDVVRWMMCGQVNDVVRWMMWSGDRCGQVNDVVRWMMWSGDWCVVRWMMWSGEWCIQVNAGRKHIGSTDAMRISVKTSELLQHRAKHIVPGVMDNMRDAILNRNFDKFAELTMKVCNEPEK